MHKRDKNFEPTLSEHAILRAAQRNFCLDGIYFTVKHGKREWRDGGIFCLMHRNKMPSDLAHNHPFWKYVGSTVILSSCGTTVITLYR